VDGVKIDKSFVADMQRDPDDLALTTAIIAMATRWASRWWPRASSSRRSSSCWRSAAAIWARATG
jgi:hypothetical protein